MDFLLCALTAVHPLLAIIVLFWGEGGEILKAQLVMPFNHSPGKLNIKDFMKIHTLNQKNGQNCQQHSS
jgi:hypothetical protein